MVENAERNPGTLCHVAKAVSDRLFDLDGGFVFFSSATYLLSIALRLRLIDFSTPTTVVHSPVPTILYNILLLAPPATVPSPMPINTV